MKLLKFTIMKSPYNIPRKYVVFLPYLYPFQVLCTLFTYVHHHCIKFCKLRHNSSALIKLIQ